MTVASAGAISLQDKRRSDAIGPVIKRNAVFNRLIVLHSDGERSIVGGEGSCESAALALAK